MLLTAWLILVFILGAAVGSGLNVCIVRIPYEKSILWPSSHCGSCFQPVKWYHNLPLLSYWILRGRCSVCKAPFSIRYFFIELFTALAFVGLFYVDVVVNPNDVPYVPLTQTQPEPPRGVLRMNWVREQLKAHDRQLAETRAEIELGLIPPRAWMYWMGHALLVSLLIVTTFTDLEHMEIPLSVTIVGMVIGLVLAACFPWPWPYTVEHMRLLGELQPPALQQKPRLPPVIGWQPWPVWDTLALPKWLGAGTWQLGLATGLGGVLAGMVILRAVRFLFGVGRGMEGLGLGDADLMMMAGAFVGWQVVVVGFFVSVFPGLILGLGRLIIYRDQQLPFGPSLALGLLITLFAWPLLPPEFGRIFFEELLMTILAVGGAVFLLITSFALRLIGGPPREASS